MGLNPSDWRSVDAETERAWFDFITRAFLDGPVVELCPSCGEATLRFYYLPSSFVDSTRRRGGHWIWCPACKRYEHSTSLIPAWWVDEDDLSHASLLPEPVWLEEHWAELGISGLVP